MTKNERIANFILNNPDAGIQQWQEFQSSEPSVRLKTVSRGQVLIHLNDKDGWMEPKVWLGNYKANVKQRLVLETDRALNVLDAQEYWDAVSLEDWRELVPEAKADVETLIRWITTKYSLEQVRSSKTNFAYIFLRLAYRLGWGEGKFTDFLEQCYSSEGQG